MQVANGYEAPLSRICLAFPILPAWAWIGIAVAGGVFLLAIVVFLFWIYKEQKEVGQVLRVVLEAFVLLRCYFLIYLWRVKFEAKKWVPLLVFVIFLIAGIVTLIEIVSRVFHASVTTFAYIEPIFGKLSVQIPLFFVECLIVFHHYTDHKKRDRESTMCAVLSQLLGPLNTVNLTLSHLTDPAAKTAARRTFEPQFAQAFVRLFHERHIDKVDIAIMRWDTELKKLKIEFPHTEPSSINLKFELDSGAGAAGKAFGCNTMIYIPHIGYKHGIEVLAKQLNVIPKTYVETEPHPFKSILCIPITGADKAPVGVLNITSPRASAFSPSEFRMATLAATIISLMI